MKQGITLKQALGVWREEQKLVPSFADEHLSFSELYEFAVRDPNSLENTKILCHLSLCSQCVCELKEILRCIAEAEVWDFALPKAAASDVEWSRKRIPAEGGKYSIVVRRDISDKSRGVISVQVEAHFRDRLEGKSIRLLDEHGRELLRGAIIDGEVSCEIFELDSLTPRFWIEPVTGEP